MKKWKLLPKLAWTGVIQNGSVYFPYICAGIFSAFTFFVFSSIVHNDLIATLPHSSYAWMFLQIGRVLLAMILFPFLYYTNGFLIKRRKKEIGLYHILGLEKKHIGSMMIFETIIVYVAILLGGVISGVLLSKLLFMLLLKMTRLPVDVEFIFYPKAFSETALLFLVIYAFNMINNIITVGKSKPTELLAGSKKGEKKPKMLWIYAALGVIILGLGYRYAIVSKLDSMIYMNFFLAVFLVVLGTYLIFTSGSIAWLEVLKKNKKYYYRPNNFITVSGMLYRMKKNAASLVNICVFSTMIIITLVCTFSLYFGLDGISDFNYPYDMDISFEKNWVGEEKIEEKIEELEIKYEVKEQRTDSYENVNLPCNKEGNLFKEEKGDRSEDDHNLNVLLLDDYNRMEEKTEELDSGQAFILCTGEDFGYDKVRIAGMELEIKKELQEFYAFPKAAKNTFLCGYYLIVKDEAARFKCVEAWAKVNGVEDVQGYIDSQSRMVRLKLDGEEAGKVAFIEAYIEWCSSQTGYLSSRNNMEGRARNASMNGGLLFIGILFSMIFIMCLILIMYYKQISEGYEDKEGFVIMQKVGMSDKEIKGTVHKQIMLVFFLPLVGSILHTSAGMFMVDNLFGTINLFNTALVIKCCLVITVIFALFYGASYLYTARTYYRIVRQGEA